MILRLARVCIVEAVFGQFGKCWWHVAAKSGLYGMSLPFVVASPLESSAAGQQSLALQSL